MNNTGLPFNSVIAIEFNQGHPTNPMVNAGAIATTSLVLGHTPNEQWDNIQTGLSEFAGRPAADSMRSCTAQSRRLMSATAPSLGYWKVMDVLTWIRSRWSTSTPSSAHSASRQRTWRVMGAALPGGGVNPLTGRRVVSAGVCRDTLAILAANGAYEHSGEWLFDIGLPGKSGVAGGMVTVAPGKAGIGVFSPALDGAGNSVRGQRATAYLSRVLGLNIFASEVCTPIPRRG